MSDRPDDIKFEITNILSHPRVRNVTDWYHFGLFLGVPPTTLHIINLGRDLKKHKTEMLLEWLKLDPEASWDKLFSALERTRDIAIEETVYLQHQHLCPEQYTDFERGDVAVSPNPLTPYVQSKETLFNAVKLGEVDRVQTLLENGGTNVNRRNKDGWTALFIAAEQDDIAIVQLLLTHNAKVDIRNKSLQVWTMDVGWDFVGVNENIDVMTCRELLSYLTADMKFPADDMKELEKREIDGEAFCHLSREDIGTIFPKPKQFILASKLYKVVQHARSSPDLSNASSDILSDLDETLSRSSRLCPSTTNSSSGSSRKRSLESSADPQSEKRRHSSGSTDESRSFKLPVFSPDIQKCIDKDAFYTPTQTQRLIKESCLALRGYCWEDGSTVSNEEKRALAKKLYDLAPNTLGDPTSAKKSPEAGLYGRIVKWFQNHSYLSRKACGEVKSKKSTTSQQHSDVEDDDEAVKLHFQELDKELKKKHHQDGEKITRLLSLTFPLRRSEILAVSAATRVTTVLKKYECFKRPIYLVQELYHVMGHKFSSTDEVKQKVSSLNERWSLKLVPAICHLAKETAKASPSSDLPDALSMYCIKTLVEKLKPRTGKSTIDERVDALICFSQSAEEAMLKNKENTHPWVMCIGSPSSISSAVLVCQRTVITKDIGKSVFSALLILLAVHYIYEFQYNPLVQQTLEFLQEKLLGDRLPTSRKISVAYSSLFRAVDCMEQKVLADTSTDKEMSEDATQAFCEFD